MPYVYTAGNKAHSSAEQQCGSIADAAACKHAVRVLYGCARQAVHTYRLSSAPAALVRALSTRTAIRVTVRVRVHSTSAFGVGRGGPLEWITQAPGCRINRVDCRAPRDHSIRLD